MSGRIRHKLRQLWAAGKLKVGGRAPKWLTQRIEVASKTEEATPEEVEQYLNKPVGVMVTEMPPDNWCVAVNRTNGKLLVSGASCLTDKDWDIRLISSREECLTYAKRHT